MRLVPLAGKRGSTRFTVVDDADYDWAASIRWPYSKDRWSPAGLAGNRRSGFLHRRLLERAGHKVTGLVTDHLDGWSLDNRRLNLLVMSHAEKTKRSCKRNIHKSSGRWCVQIAQKVIGRFETPEEAEIAYEDAARAAGYLTLKQRAELLIPIIEQLEAWVTEGILIRHNMKATLIEDRYRLNLGN
jgi:hypothetical protein